MKNNIVMNTKKIVIVFFVLVFVMGFFSKSIVNIFLPKVIVEHALDGFVERTLKVEGVIEAKKSFRVRLGGDIILEEYFVKTGDVVEVGKPLFRIDKSYGIKGNSPELEGLNLQLEIKKSRLNSLKLVTYVIDEKNIAAMEHKLDKSKEEIATQQELFAAGIISKQEMEVFDAGIEQQEFDVEISKLMLLEKKRNDEDKVKELDKEIKNDVIQIRELKNQNAFYGKVDNEGIFYSTSNGIVTYLSDIQSIIPGHTVITEIADLSSEDALIYKLSISEENYDLVKSVGEIQINGDSMKDSMYFKITSTNKLNDKEMYQVVAAVDNKYKENVQIKQNLEGIIKQKVELTGHNKVPKAAVINFEAFKEGSTGTVFLLEENVGLLGKEYRAKEMEIKILAVGDDEVVVSGLENIEEPKVIKNLSYKINNGAKVFLWQ